MTEQDVLYGGNMAVDPESPPVQTQTEKYLLFVSNNLLFGVPAAAVEEIITNHTITSLPLVPDYIRGIINLRGQIIPIVDICCFLGQDEERNSCIIILQTQDTQIGILVDQVEKMVDIPVGSIVPSPSQSGQKLVCGMCSLEDGQTMLAFDCAQLLELS